MKLLRAEFKNFRLLRDLEIDFSSNSDRKLTVIRAANESGKTTILRALQWVLYGDDALPNKGKDFRLHPIDWDAKADGASVSITATLDFEAVKYLPGRKERRAELAKYRIIRSASEDADSKAKRSPSTVKLYEITGTGHREIPHPESIIGVNLPENLREVFFTDGDRALSFIEADEKTKRQRVKSAIRSLLGLEVIEAAIGHIEKTSAQINRDAKKVTRDDDLQRIFSRLSNIQEEQEKLEKDLIDARQQIDAFSEQITQTENYIQKALEKGNKEELSKEYEATKKEYEQIADEIKSITKKHSDLFKSPLLAQGLLTSALGIAYDKLDELRNKGEIPNSTIPILEETLDSGTCICGEKLDSSDKEGKRRCEHIKELIKKTQEADDVREIITDLYFKARAQRSSEDSKGWSESYREIVVKHDDLKERQSEKGRKIAKLDEKIEAVGDTDVQGLKKTLNQYREMHEKNVRLEQKCETELDVLKKEREELEKERDARIREGGKIERIQSKISAVDDLIKVLNSTFERILNEELTKVSERMDAIFREMIVADPKQNSIIHRAEISREFDIIVYGPQGRTLDPDNDLNGASRRALTLAFILALTQVSGANAPNVIDTPLGMAAGQVRRSILKTAVRESSQIVLFLTHDEILGCEEIIDKEAGKMMTLTNTAHSRMLVNDPGAGKKETLVCECDHKSECKICQRVKDRDEEHKPDTIGESDG